MVMGVVVDSALGVIALNLEQIKPASWMSSVLDTDYLTGLESLDKRMLILVDIDKVMTNAEMGLVVETTR